MTKIINITQSNTGMYTKESSQRTFKIHVPDNNLDVRFEKAYQNHYNEIVQNRMDNKISHNI